MLQALPTALGVLFVGDLKAWRGGHPAAIMERRIFVALPVQRREHILVEFGRLFKHRLCSFKTRIFKAGYLCNLFNACQMLDIEEHVFEGRDVAHGVSL